MKTFEKLGLLQKNIKTLYDRGFEEPTEIQEKTIPVFLKDELDIIAQAQTGTGKTAAFALPIIEKIDQSVKKVQAFILAPTRELVIQVCEEINLLKGENNLSVIPIYGGQSIDLQLKSLKKGVSIVVGTPGRVLDHLKRKTLRLDAVKYFILDEADEMLNMGFIEDIENIFGHTPKEKRVCLFSATMPSRIKKLAENYMGKYVHIKTDTELATSLTDQIYFEVARKNKFEALCRIIDIEKDFYGIVFCRTKIDVDDIVSHLIDRGYLADALHGDISQAQREKILRKFKKGQLTVLVATDVAARGIDVYNLSHVINYSIPQNPESYIHRIGRTGRAGKQGVAITFITSDEFRKLGFIKRIAKVEIRKQNLPKVAEIINAKKREISDNLEKILSANKIDEYKEWAKKLIEDKPAHDVVAGILKYSFGKILDENNYQKITSLKDKKRGKNVVEGEGKTRLFIAKGKESSMTKRKIADFIINNAGISNGAIENIEIYDKFSFITVPFTEAEIILEKFRNSKGSQKRLVEKAKKKKF